jgi:PTS system nitrogen regulatory IIA component
MRIDVRDAAKYLGVSSKTIYRWIQQGKAPAYKVGDQYRFERTELFEWALAQRLLPAPELLSDGDGAASAPSLSDCLERGGIIYRVHGDNKKEILENTLKSTRGLDEQSTEPLLEMLLARERLSSTAIGDGIAIPHPRSPLVMYVSQPILSLAFLERPVDYGALDGKPVHALFMLISPTLRAHLRILSSLAHALHEKAFKSAVTRQEGREALLDTLKKIESQVADTTE